MKKSATSTSAGLKKVPPFPPVAVKLIELLGNPAAGTGEIADLIRSDAAFTAGVLQRVNSAEFGMGCTVTNIQQAVTLLGVDRTRQVTLSHATVAYSRGAPRTNELRRCWEHTVATAVLAEEIAQSCHAFAQVAFTAGIMHDIGRLGLVAGYPHEYELVMRGAAEHCLDLLDFEKEQFGIDHAEAGRILAKRWGLPAEICVIAGRHHDPCEGSELDLLSIVQVACRLADALGFEVVKPLVPQTPETVLEALPPRACGCVQKSPEELRGKVDRQILEFAGG